MVPDRVREHHAGYRRNFHIDPSVRAMGHGRDLYARRKDGSEFPVEVGLSPFHTPQGDMVMASVVDISSRREREEREARFRAERDTMLRLAVEASPSGMVMCRMDDAGTITLVNATAECMFGYSRQQMVGQSIDMLVPNRMKAEHLGLRAAYNSNPRVKAAGHTAELMAQRSDGTEFPAEVSRCLSTGFCTVALLHYIFSYLTNVLSNDFLFFFCADRPQPSHHP